DNARVRSARLLESTCFVIDSCPNFSKHSTGLMVPAPVATIRNPFRTRLTRTLEYAIICMRIHAGRPVCVNREGDGNDQGNLANLVLGNARVCRGPFAGDGGCSIWRLGNGKAG